MSNDSVLILHKLVFDKIEFNRLNLEGKSDPKIEITRFIDGYDNGIYKINLSLSVDKEDEYTINISIAGFFELLKDNEILEVDRQKFIYDSAIAILMPYIRSELSLLTAQPNMTPIVLPPINTRTLFTK